MEIALWSVIVLFVLVCLILILLVLIQKGRGGGLASAFGGGGGNTAFGSKTGDVLTWATSIVFGVFLLLAVSLSVVADRVHTKHSGGTQNQQPTTPGSAPCSPIPPQQK